MALNLQTTNQMGGRSLVDASNNPILKSILEGTAALQVDPVSQKPKGKKEQVSLLQIQELSWMKTQSG